MQHTHTHFMNTNVLMLLAQTKETMRLCNLTAYHMLFIKPGIHRRQTGFTVETHLYTIKVLFPHSCNSANVS